MRVYVKYSHNPANFDPVYLLFTRPSSESEENWVPTFRDTVKGKRVVWANTDSRPSEVWLKDSNGIRPVTGQEFLSV